MLYTFSVDDTTHTLESDEPITCVIVGRIVSEGENPSLTPAAPPPHQVLGHCTSREEAEVSLQTLFKQGLFSDLEIIEVQPAVSPP
jgi:hypothetical protein